VLRDAIFAGMQHPTVYPCMPQFGVHGEPWLAALVFDDVVIFDIIDFGRADMALRSCLRRSFHI
jgi:hypothetical protein